MKLNLGMTFSERFHGQRIWHDWYAWHPVWVAHKDWRWLEAVQRVRAEDNWSYRVKPDEKPEGGE